MLAAILLAFIPRLLYTRIGNDRYLTTNTLVDAATPVEYVYNSYGQRTSTLEYSAGTYAVSASIAAGGNYASASATGTLTIAKAAIALSVNGGAFVYDGQPHAASVTATGAGGAPVAPVIVTYDGGSAAPVAAGTYAVQASFAGSGNYEPASAAGTVVITRAAPALSWNAPAAIVHGVPLSAVQLNATASVAGTFVYAPAAGTVTIRADVTVSGVTFTTSTSVISIGGAVPSAHHFTLATSRFNLPGLVKAGFEATLSVFLADRFSNFNILQGTQVSFFTEAGAVDTSVNLDATGRGDVTIRTQNPMPAIVTAVTPLNRNGHLRVIAVARGEEGFFDVNGNGLYDPGIDTFTAAMDLGEPFVDTNDNGVWDGPGCTQVGCDPTHSGEQFVDANGNGRYDAANGVWDGPGCTQAGCVQNPTIWQSIRLQFTGNLNCTITPLTFALANAGSQAFTITVFDDFENTPVPGTTIGISATGAIVQGGGSFSVLDQVSSAPYSRSFTISDPDPTTPTAAAASVTVTVTTPAGEVATCGNSPLVVNGTTL
jgi:adhesin/invasin